MDSCEDAATLEWWANRSACLGRLRVRIVVRTAGDDWTCEATLEAAEDRESFDFLMQLDPHFTLRFYDASILLVKVVEAGVGVVALVAELGLWPATGSATAARNGRDCRRLRQGSG
ncbi:hypothetical protein [Streptomyces qinzhouensis]|uniref:hypothetical protein n=1 Tax=Streptomyces qinzhouensis TaxID=2599401 RepID=UPI00164866AF|nr:hypothetical protein [Streptomyces qinzhouensis]